MHSKGIKHSMPGNVQSFNDIDNDDLKLMRRAIARKGTVIGQS